MAGLSELAGGATADSTFNSQNSFLASADFVVTMDPQRSVIRNGGILVSGTTIHAVGSIDQLRHGFPGIEEMTFGSSVMMPGMVDLHGKVGHAVLRSLGEHLPGPDFRRLWDEVALRHATQRWFYVDAQLGAAEKLLNGCTAVVTQAGAAQARMDDERPTMQVIQAIEDLGMRARIIAGIGRAPWPQQHGEYVEGAHNVRETSFERSLDTIESIVAAAASSPRELSDVCVGSARFGNANPADPMYVAGQESYVSRQAAFLRDIMDRYQVGFFTNGYGNAVEYAFDHELGLLGPTTIISHGNGLSERAIGILAHTATKVSHNPRTRRLYEYGQDCTVVEMLEAGVVVGLGSDGPAPDRPGDPLATAQAAIRHQRERFSSHMVLPPGKALEMLTVDGSRALGWDRTTGSLEAGKTADFISIDLRQPHLWPTTTPVEQIVYFATGADVSNVFVNGRQVVRDGILTSIDQGALLDEAAQELERLLSISELNLADLATAGPGFGQARRPGGAHLFPRESYG